VSGWTEILLSVDSLTVIVGDILSDENISRACLRHSDELRNNGGILGPLGVVVVVDE